MAIPTLEEYRRKRDFKQTPEPSGDPIPRAETDRSTWDQLPHGRRFCVQKHRATRMHFDFRLEHDGVLLSWAVPRGPSLDPAKKRLAVQTEDHPIDYGEFEGVIPSGYGAGTVMLWDIGTFEWVKESAEDFERSRVRGDIKFRLQGSKLSGEFALIHIGERGRQYGGSSDGDKNWLMLKKRDASVVEGFASLAQRAGFDLADDIPAVADWLAGVDGPLVLGNYVYADGADNVRVASAVDALTVRLQAERPDLALAFLATPTDVFAVPPDAVAQSARAYAARSPAGKLGRGLLQSLSGRRLLRPAYPAGSDPGICDSLVAQQGPNYALAKRLQRWRATISRDAGAAVSMNVAPPTRTRSVTRNRVLAAAYAGAGRFGVEVFEPATTKALMAALLVHDLHAGQPAAGHPWQDEAHAAAHGGLWRMAYTPRSALSLAALLGYTAARNQARRS